MNLVFIKLFILLLKINHNFKRNNDKKVNNKFCLLLLVGPFLSGLSANVPFTLA